MQSYGKVITYYIEHDDNMLYYEWIMNIVNSFISRKYYYAPLVGIFRDSKLTAIILGVMSEEIFEQILAEVSSVVYVYIQGETHSVGTIPDKEIIELLSSLFKKENLKTKNTTTPSLIFVSLALLAINDMLSLCGFYVLAFLSLSLSFFEIKKEKMFRNGIFFSTGIFIGLFLQSITLFGINLLWLKCCMTFLILIIGILESLKFFDNSPTRILVNFLQKRNREDFATFIIGFIVSVLVFPFSSLTNSAILSLLLKGSFERMATYLVYSIIFSLQPLTVTMLTSTLSHAFSNIKILNQGKKKWSNLFIGVTSIILCLLTLLRR
ncbi:MAG: hypothetical protein QXL85_05990 [Candidatus Bathyarchaeia archaeon]